MHCAHCGAEQQQDDPFCSTCGTAVAGRSRGLVWPLVVAVPLLLAALAGLGYYLSNRTSSGVGAATGTASPAVASQTPSPTPTAMTQQALYRTVANGVIRIETTACQGGGVGTGFLVAPNLVATVAHVVDGARSVVLRQGATSTTGAVIGIDRGTELALVRTSTPLAGHVFGLASSLPDIGTPVAVIGYPLAGPESLTSGSISGQDRSIDVGPRHLTGLLQTDASINPGNSGGPLLALDGSVVGLVLAKNLEAAGIGFGVPATAAASAVARWTAAPTAVPGGNCAGPTGPGGVPPVVLDASGAAQGPAVDQMFTTYVTGINTGAFGAAYSVLSGGAQRATSLDRFVQGESSSYIVTLTIDTVTPTTSGLTATVRFRSVQDPQAGGHGQACSDWDMTYGLVPDGAGGWLIDRATPAAGSPAAC